MLGADRRIGQLSSSRLQFPSTHWNLIVRFSILVPGGGQLWGHKYDISTSRYLFSLFVDLQWHSPSPLPCQLEADRYPVATHCSHRPAKQNCQRGSGHCFHFRLDEDFWFIVRLCTQSHCHMPGIPRPNFILQTPGGKNTLPESLVAIAPSCLFSPYKGLAHGRT